MNTSRVVILGAAALAAGLAAFLARGLLGGGTEKVKAAPLPPPVTTAEVLVAADAIQAGAALTPATVRWQTWPKSSVDSSFITHDEEPDVNHVVTGAVVREPLVAGEPLTAAKIVHADSAGFMAAMVTPGMRAVSVSVSTESGAGGFILPNDRVDVVETALVSETPRRYMAKTILNDVRVLAVDQTYKEDKDQKAVLAKTATLELSQVQAELVELAQSTGTLSLALRALGDSGLQNNAIAANSGHESGPVYIIRYGVGRPASEPKE
ncbi:MAG: Flp pilus assembly protein CpaB [Rhizomicrobium sp.]|jgi:pilus assembly protein CpaB